MWFPVFPLKAYDVLSVVCNFVVAENVTRAFHFLIWRYSISREFEDRFPRHGCNPSFPKISCFRYIAVWGQSCFRISGLTWGLRNARDFATARALI